MKLLDRCQINKLLESTEDNSLFLDPLVEGSQVGNVTIDLRLGYDFLVSILTRKPYIELGPKEDQFHRGVASYFQETRREIGDRFVLYPNQVVLTTTLEYISLPSNVYADILSRSSFTRLGIHINTMVQPGFRGCVPLELFNHGNNVIELVVGSRICQARLFEIDNPEETEYHRENKTNYRKYYGDVRPSVSKADLDEEVIFLSKLNKSTK